ncbi:MAG: neutral zinc metallopeptidase [Xanthomonadales bacterium]|nr:neutral zinc metallopeptidase [Xanthomonadales bacterium]
MKWKGRRSSSNVEDARGRQASAGGGAGAGMLLNLVGRTFGIKGILVLLVIGFFLWMFGLVDPSQVIGGKPTVTEVDYQPSAEEQERYDFVTVVLADTEDVWNAAFRQQGAQYQEPQLTIYKGRVNTACGMGEAAMGPFYCPGDKKIYIDLGFYDELARDFKAPGDFAQAYVIAHEVGHHVQNLLGISDRVNARRGQRDFNEWSVRLELQADYLAGVWANHNSNYLDRGDIEEAMVAANAIGDDTIQQRTQGRVVPHAFTHGTSEQRQRWFNQGLRSGDMTQGDTFAMPYDQL